jgi:hypothetical protein
MIGQPSFPAPKSRRCSSWVLGRSCSAIGLPPGRLLRP